MDNLIIIPFHKKYTYSYWLAVNKIIDEEIYFLEKEAFDYDSTKEFIEDCLEYDTPFLLLINEENDRVVGWCDVRLVNYEDGLLGIGILGPYRNLGYGKLLIQNIISLCKEIDLKHLLLQVRENNTRAIHLYSSFGFTEYNRIFDDYYDLKEDIIEMGLDL